MKKIIETKFTYENYSKLIQKIFKNIEINEPFEEKPELKSFEEDIKGFYNLGVYADKDGERTLILAVETNKSVDKERRIQKTFVQRLIQAEYYDNALVAFYNGESNEWRLSLITEKDNKSKLFSYLVGESQTTKTVIHRLGLLAAKEDITKQDLEETFSVGTLNDDFFKHYKELHENLVKHLEENGLVEGKYEFNADEFSKKLMGQVVFLYFLQKKQWLGGEIFKEYLSNKEFNEYAETDKRLIVRVYENNTEEYRFNKEFKLNKEELNKLNYSEIDEINNIINGRRKIEGDSNFIRNIYNRMEEGENFLHDYLEPLFYMALNRERGKCGYFKELDTKVPFLNGGLFDHLGGYDWKQKEININNEMFSNEEGTGILDIFEKYNFTVHEASESDADYGIDPEMLGHIFESLMGEEDKKSKGTVYTPREIVSYMCKESLIHYLDNNSDIHLDDIEKFIHLGDSLRYSIEKDNRDKLVIPKSIIDNIEKIDELLENVKVAEPSVGSGTFLVGMLKEIVQARLNLLEYRIMLNPKKEIEMRYGEAYEKYTSYNMKLHAIKNSLYAVDIEPSAIHISKLRLWLSLVIDDKGDKEVHKLPNLDFKIRCGNSLIEEFEGVNLSIGHIDRELKSAKGIIRGLSVADKHRKEKKEQTDRLEIVVKKYKDSLQEMLELKDKYFNQHEYKNKKDTEDNILKLEKEIFKTILTIRGKQDLVYKLDRALKNESRPFFLWDNYFYEVYVDSGFDIVIGNPPYVRGSRIENKALIKKEFEEVYTGNADLLIYFYVLGFNLLKDKGILSYITSNKWLRAGYGEKFRKYLLENVDVLDIIDFGGLEIFEGTGVDVNILTGRKSKELDEWNYTDGSKWE